MLVGAALGRDHFVWPGEENRQHLLSLWCSVVGWHCRPHVGGRYDCLSISMPSFVSAFVCSGVESSLVTAAVAKVIVVYALFAFPLLVWRQ